MGNKKTVSFLLNLLKLIKKGAVGFVDVRKGPKVINLGVVGQRKLTVEFGLVRVAEHA